MPFVRNGALVVRLSGKEMELVAADALHIRGAHNALNALAAAACGLIRSNAKNLTRA